VVGDALWLTLLVNVTALIFVHLVAIPAAIYSATHRHTVGDAVVTVLGYVGLAVPGFLLALIMLFYANRWFGLSIGGLYDSALTNQPWDGEKIRSRLARGREEFAAARDFDYLVINDTVDHAVAEIRAIMTAEHCRPAERAAQIEC